MPLDQRSRADSALGDSRHEGKKGTAACALRERSGRPWLTNPVVQGIRDATRDCVVEAFHAMNHECKVTGHSSCMSQGRNVAVRSAARSAL